MTVGDLRKALSDLPEDMSAAIFLDEKTTILDDTGDRISGTITDYFRIKSICLDREFCPDKGFQALTVLYAGTYDG